MDRQELAEIKGKIREYESITIGLDIGITDNAAISIAQVNKDSLYQLYGKTYKGGDEDCIKLVDLLKLKETTNFKALSDKEERE